MTMTPDQIEAMRADMAAGTQGAWSASYGHTQMSGVRYWQIETASDAICNNQFCWAAPNDESSSADASRIARVPDMEATILAQAEQIERMREALDFQARVKPWMDACFGPDISADRLERGDRLLEEVLELLQSGQYPRERIAALVEYVWSRPEGEPAQEVGGVMVTLAAYCLAHGINTHEAGETELARIWTKVEKIRAKQAAKPTGSALPVALTPTPTPGGSDA